MENAYPDVNIKGLYPKLYSSSVSKHDGTNKAQNAKYCKGEKFFKVGDKGAIWKNGLNFTSNTSYIHYAYSDSNFECSNYKTSSNNVYILTTDEKAMKVCKSEYSKDDILLICAKSTPLPPNGVPCNCYDCATSTPRTYGVCSPANKSCNVFNGSPGSYGCYTDAPSSCDCSINAYNKSDEIVKQPRWKCKSSTNPLKATCVECPYYDLSCPYATKKNCENVCQLRSRCDNSSTKGKYNPMCIPCPINDKSCPFTNILNKPETQCDGHCHPKSEYQYKCSYATGNPVCIPSKGTNISKAQCQKNCV